MADPFPPDEARERRVGAWVSGVAHTLMIGAVALGGALFRAPQAPAVRMAPVETMSARDFEAMAAASRGAGPVGDEASATPAQPRAPSDEVVAGGPVALAPPAPNADPTALPAPDVSGEAAPNLSDLLVPQTPVAVATVAPAPQQPSAVTEGAMAEPEIAAAARPRPPAPAPALDQPAPAAAEQPQVPPSPPALTSSRAPFEVAAARQRLADRQAAAEAARAEEAREQAAREQAAREEAARAEEQRLAAEAAARAEADRAAAAAAAAAAQEAERAEAEARAREQAERQAALEAEARAAEQAREQARAEAEREAAREAEREAERQAARDAAREAEREAERRAQQERRRAEEEAAAAAAAALARAEQEAERARAAAEARQQAEAPRAAPDEPDALTQALEQAMADQPEGAGADGGGGRAAQGPPLSRGEKDGLRLQIEACWNIGSLSREAQRTSVTVEFEMSPDGMPEPDSVRMVGSEGGSDAAAAQAFEAARRAILRCALQKDGYRLPSEKYARWRQTIIDFRPQGGPSIR